MSVFTRTELLALEPADLLDLLDIADGNNIIEQAQSLGLDTDDAEQWAAVLAAHQHAHGGPEAFSPPIGAGQDGVRSDLTPAVPDDGAAIERLDDIPTQNLGTLTANPGGAKAIALEMDESAATGRPFMAGTFAMYATPTGEVVMVTEGIGDGIQRSIVPRRYVRAALSLMAGEGGLKLKMLGKIFGHG